MKKKRGQITVFVILGMIIVSVFAFLFYTASYIERAKLEGQAEEIIQEVEQTQSIKHYLYLCLKQSAEDSIAMIGEQGGRIYDYQNGASRIDETPHLELSFNGTRKNVSFGLFSPKLNPPYSNSPYPNVPWYPEEQLNYDFIDTSIYYYLGDNKLPFLCDKYGPNKYNFSKNITGASCHMRNVWYWSTRPQTIQIQIANYTSYLVKECIDTDYFYNFKGYNITIGDPKTVATFGEYDVTFDTDLPINIIFNRPGRRQPIITKSIYLHAQVPVRLKRIYDFVLEIVKEEKNNITFNFYDDYENISSYKWLKVTNEGVNVTKTDVSPGRFEKIMRITDYKSIIRGLPYYFQILISNRIPVLDWIQHNTDISSDYDIIAPEQSVINIVPKFFEPDEEYVTINYSGWKETEDYYFNYSCCIQRGFVDCLNSTTNGGCAENISNEPHNWTRSANFMDTKKDANYSTGKSDIGIHEINVSVCDPQGLCDWQIVRIVVYDYANAVATPLNNFSDINNTYASIEDPFVLDAGLTNSIINVGGMGPYIWCDNIEFPNCYEVYTQQFMLPPAATPFNIKYDIENITLYNFNQTGPHRINLAVGGGFDEFDIEVFQCIPHRDNAPSYPYNNFSLDDYYDDEENPYMANHTCCAGSPEGPTNDWRIAGTATTCYNLEEYGSYLDFTRDHIEEIYGLELSDDLSISNIIYFNFINAISVSGSGLTNLHNDKINDLIQRTFTRNCDGQRGNICNGSVTESIRAINCGDQTWSTGLRCQGVNLDLGPSFVDPTPNSCVAYPGETFEYALQQITGPAPDESMRLCENIPRCSTANTYNVTDGRYVCNATCDNSGGCTRSSYQLNPFNNDCIDCWSLTDCTDSDVGMGNPLYYTNKGYVTGGEFGGCPGDDCDIQTHTINDMCLIGGQFLREYRCRDDNVPRSNQYYSTIISCSGEFGDADCKNSTNIDYYEYRNASSCGDGACSTESYDVCQRGYACDQTWNKIDGDYCTSPGICLDDNQCADGWYCVISAGRICLEGDIGNFCDDEFDCDSGNCNMTSSTCL